MIENFTKYLNKTVLPGKIKFEPEYNEKYLDFLDVRVHLRGGYLIPEIHSKPTDLHEYLNPVSSDPPQVAKNNPYSIALRIRRNCSDRMEQDQFFVDNLIKYKAYLLHSGYDSEMVDEQFVKVAKMKRKETLKTRTKPKLKWRKYSFVTTWDPEFPDIREALHKFTNVLMEDEECREVFPKGSFRVVFKKGHKNLKEIIAPSRSMFSIMEGPCGKNRLGKEGSCKKCGKCGMSDRGRKKKNINLNNCMVLQEGTHFRSSVTGEKLRIKQEINCRRKNIIYLVTCGACGR